MYLNRISMVFVIVSLFASLSKCNLKYCEECINYDCIPDEELNCKYGYLPDECNCCQLCAKGEGEICGGHANHGGICASGLQCQNKQKYTQLPGICINNSKVQPTANKN